MIQFSVEIPDGKGGTIPLWRAIPERAGKANAITATGRQWGEGDYFNEDAEYCISSRHPIGILVVFNANDNIRYHVGQMRAIQPGRGKPGMWYRGKYGGINTGCEYAHETISPSYAIYDMTYQQVSKDLGKDWLRSSGFRPARIRITSLDKLDVRTMTDEQARRTGFASAVDYLAWWANKYDNEVDVSIETSLHKRLSATFKDKTRTVHIKFYPKLAWLTRLLKDCPAEIYTMLYIGFEFVAAE